MANSGKFPKDPPARDDGSIPITESDKSGNKPNSK